MARSKKDAPVNLDESQELTAGMIERLSCPLGKTQAFLRDTKAPGLRVRVTGSGAKSFVFEAKLHRQTIRKTIGDVRAWTIEAARAESNILRVKLDSGVDPREVERQQQAEREAAATSEAAKAITVGDAWPQYLIEGKPKRRDAWKAGYKADLVLMASAGGEKKKRGKGLTRPGPLFPLMAWALVDVAEDALKVWFDNEALKSKHQAARALMMFRGFLRWCAMKPEYRALVDRHAGSAPALVESLPQVKKRTDALQMAQVRGWWAGVEQLDNRTASVYLRALLVTGARREELAALTWDMVDFQWRRLTIADKVEESRTIPMTPYLAQLLATLPRVSKYVFASTGKMGRISDVRSSHAKVLKHAGIEHLTFHGLRRSFIQLGRRVVPAGVPAQIAGHKPSATAEGYAVLSLDDLRPYAAQVEAHILELAGVQFVADLEPGKLALVANNL